MQTNNFAKASECLAEDIVCDWVLSNERIIGRNNFTSINNHYPASGRWSFTVKRIVSEGNQVVTDIDVTDGSVSATAVTFHTVEAGLITKQIEYWVEPYSAPDWRKPWVVKIE